MSEAVRADLDAIERLREALYTYGQHFESCPWAAAHPDPESECTCGLTDVLVENGE